MSADVENLLREARDRLRLRDIVLYGSRLERGPLSYDSDDTEAIQQHKRGVQFSKAEIVRDGEQVWELQILVSLGERVVRDPNAEDPAAYFSIEADYLVLYQMIGEISDAALKAFANFNAVHNVWPFWRQHVFDLIAQARLPALQVPLFSGNGP